jgi:hypothetical protein
MTAPRHGFVHSTLPYGPHRDQVYDGGCIDLAAAL